MLKSTFLCSLIFLCLTHIATAQVPVQIIVEALPPATSSTDTIYICGSFNNWKPNEVQYALKKQLNGQLAIKLGFNTFGHEYKFTRGSWTKVETDIENNYIDNRKFILDQKTVYVRIDNWLDLGGARPLNYIVFYFFACAFQALLLLFLVYRVRQKMSGKLKAMLLVTSVLTLLLLLGVIYQVSNQIWQSYCIFLFHISLQCWAPLLLYFFYKMQLQVLPSRFRIYFLPAAIALFLALVRIFNIQFFSFLAQPVWSTLTLGNVFIFGSSAVFTFFVLIFIVQKFPAVKSFHLNSKHPASTFLSRFYWVNVLALISMPLTLLFLVNGWRYPFFEDFHTTALLLTLLIFIETYFLWRYPEIIEDERVATPVADNLQEWIPKLNLFMLEVKPYKKADLTISDLAEMLETKPHILSRIINDAYKKNFRDFVNTYRVEEFIALANTKDYKHYTFLALAQEVGFNSKSTFNLAFKKVTDQNPRDFFKSHETQE
ncbi:helix-turn-helix domain-containing protein [Chryseotalea sanaruensis]|nr:helix-turn-helix domain-containing protein [Chryseotalea sanaruensis]